MLLEVWKWKKKGSLKAFYAAFSLFSGFRARWIDCRLWASMGAAVSCNYSGFPKETLELQFRRRFFSFFVRSQIAVKSSSRIRSVLIFNACATFWVMSKWHCLMADDEKLSRCKISIDTVYNTLKTHTKYVHIVRGRPALKDVERFRNGSVREPYERSLYERTWVNLSSRNTLYQLSYLMLVERSIDVNLIAYVDLIVNSAEYQYEVWKG